MHALEGHDADGKIVNRDGVILSTHNFWSHISWRTRRVLSVVFAPNTSNSKVCDSKVAYIFKKRDRPVIILRLWISV